MAVNHAYQKNQYNRGMTETMGDRIKQVIDELGLTLEAFGRPLGINKASVSNWINNNTKNLRNENLFGIEDHHGICARWIVTGIGPKYTRQKQEKMEIKDTPSSYEVRIPVIFTLFADRFSWNDIHSLVGKTDEMLMFVDFNGFEPFTTRGHAGKFAILIKGDKLGDTLKSGVAVLIDPSTEPMPNDWVFVELTNGQCAIAELLNQALDETRLLSIDGEKHRFTISSGEIKKISLIFGIVPPRQVIKEPA